MKINNRFLQIASVIVAVSIPLTGLMGISPGPTAAQGPGSITGTPVVATQSAVVDFAELAAMESSSPSPSGPPIGEEAPFNVYVEPGSISSPTPQIAPAEPQTPSVPSPSPSISYQGLDDIAKVGTGTFNIPPDTMGAVGPDRVLDTLNNNYRVQDKATGATISTTNFNTFWAGTGATGLFDPVTRYDPYNNRFIVVGASNSTSATSSIVVGVSTGTDPNGTYNLFRFQICSVVPCGAGADNWADYPTVGFNKNWVAISVNMFGIVSGTFVETRVLVVNYPMLLAGSFSATIFTGISDFTVQPCVTYSSTEGTLYAPTHFSSAGASYRLNTITGTPAAPVYTTGALKTHTLSPLSGGWSAPSGDALPQANGVAGGDSITINSGDARIENCVFRNNNIWYAQGVSLPAGSPTHDAAQWVRLDTSGNDVDGGRIEDPTATATNGGFWYSRPSISVNALNDALIGFTQLASNQFAAAGYALRRSGDPAGTFRDPLVYKAGEGFYWKTFDCANSAARNRWGDYSNTQVDPSDDTSFWTLQEYSKPEGSPFAASGCNSGVWSTWWAKVAVSGTDTIGLYRPSTNTFFLRNSNTFGPPDLIIPFGAPGDLPVVGDWDGNGTTTIGLYRPSTNTFFLRNTNSFGPPDLIIPFGAPNDLPVVGDWDGL